ncbi:tetratricopeptide repeat protein, partial [Candidatus Sumerlaeota bacterium]|nr:tetratricopeptide repeat protein [Candidatus Sumerlaeota bacterium]
LVKKAVDYSSEDPVLYDHLGDIYAKSGDKEKALENWRQAIRLDPQFEEVKAKIDETSKGKRRAPNREQ